LALMRRRELRGLASMVGGYVSGNNAPAGAHGACDHAGVRDGASPSGRAGGPQLGRARVSIVEAEADLRAVLRLAVAIGVDCFFPWAMTMS
jgi:hypothetical protein